MNETPRPTVTQRMSEALGVFSPAQGLMPGPTTQWSEQTVVLLRGRLRALTVLISAAAALFTLRAVFVHDPVPWQLHLVATSLIIGVTIFLYSPIRLTLWPLRAVEVMLFFALSAWLMWIDYQLALHALRTANPDAAVGLWQLAILHSVLLIVAYALFVPNNWQRAALIIAPMGAAPLLAQSLFVARHPEVRAAAALDPELGLLPLSIGGLLLATSVAVAVYGTHVIRRYRVAAAQAGEMGQYELERRIGQGGMGEVWLARHRMLARPAAIKLIRPEMLGDSERAQARRLLERFEREARVTASLGSPHTVELYDFGITDDGTFYYVMEYLDGRDLETLVRSYGPLPAERVVYLLRQACESLAEAHAHGLIHRDIKPANLYACRMGRSCDFVKVLDFGLVKPMVGGPEMTALTQEGTPAGTPAFMAPEMALDEGTIDARSDIYALGCVAFWLVTGQYVFVRDNAVAMAVDHVKTAPQPPSRRTEIAVPLELDALVLRCLEKDPARRYASAEELADAFDAVPLEGRWTEKRAAEWWRLHLPAPRSDEVLRP